MSDERTILFTAFEPSGDAIAAALIAALKQREPELQIFAFGGPQMQHAGATLIEDTTKHPAMLAGAASQAIWHRKLLGRIKRWLDGRQLTALVPTDSPAANWGICKLIRTHQPQARVIHLVAPQLWAWAAWRIRKLRRLSDHVLCIMPFEPDWFAQREMPATFVGHPLFEDAGGPTAAPQVSRPPRLALLPGSRAAEIRRNWPTILAAWHQLQSDTPALETRLAASDPERARQVELLSPRGRLPEAIEVHVNQATQTLDWADVAVIVSGTATLHAASRRTPLVSFYNINPLSWHLVGRWVVNTRTFTLPNLIGQWLGMGRVVPEFVPHRWQVQPLVDALTPLLHPGDAQDRQQQAFHAIARCFADQPFGPTASDKFLELIGSKTEPGCVGPV